MAEAVIILSPRASDAATLAASSEVATLPVANLQNMQPKKKWRSNGSTSPYIEFDFGAAGCAANGLALIGHNLTGAATLRIRGKATYPVTSSPTVDTTAVSAWPATGKPTDEDFPHFLSWLDWSNAVALRYWRLDIADAGNAAGYIEAGRVMLGAYWQPTITIDLGGVPLGFDQRDVQTFTDYGETFTDARTASAPRLFQVQISAADKLEVLNGIAEIRRLRGMWGDVACLLDPAATTHFHRESMQGVFTAQQRHNMTQQFTANGEMWSVDLPLREVI